jgi:hypothetical protein
MFGSKAFSIVSKSLEPEDGKLQRSQDRQAPSRLALGTRRSRIVRSFAALAFAFATCLTLAAAPVGAQSFGTDGKVYAKVDCNLATHKATVWVYGLNPSAYNSTGLYYYVRVWAKERSQPAASYQIMREGQTGLLKTLMSNGAYSWAEPVWLLNTPIFGAANYKYDIYVQYWFAPPGRAWSSMGGFRVQDDLGQFTYLGQTGQSTITVNGVATSDCTL